MLLIHLCGTSCSGKTSLIQSLEDKVACFDIRKDFYEKHGCLVDDVIDWDEWKRIMPMLETELVQFVETTHPPLIIESSGTNSELNRIVGNFEQKGFKVQKIYLRTPTDEELITRAKFKKVKVNKVIEFAYKYRKKVEPHLAMTIEEARDYILNLIRREKDNA